MKKLTFWNVLKSNLKCAFCNVKCCPVKYMPNRNYSQWYGGSRWVTRCEKDKEAELRNIAKQKLP